MGTLVHSDIRSRKEMIEYLTKRDTSDGYEVLDHSANGNILYMLIRHPKGYRFIGVSKMSGPSASDRSQGDFGWGHKDLDESVGPNFYDCPERILSQSDVEDRHGWREQCRQVRRKKAATKEWAKTLQPGTTLQIHRGMKMNDDKMLEPVYEDVIFDYNWSATYFVGHRPNSSTQYRYRWCEIRIPEVAMQAVA